ncbi:ABC transporter substrate-binding protein [Cytobacillus sp. S13-E01]|uniref:ABC transporter substrate-binding protein n=1 Tax=Cytobacillus sp. S13-E01 TaxID=3031326 RepID=UPI0023D7F873|nr:ABC transporter substrate-binding protein [Cytobacillus sp. S13-E01]MDF0727643.1 ABC transporter substrate-binding protein [Cytobacillus sp. S13-E01]
MRKFLLMGLVFMFLFSNAAPSFAQTDVQSLKIGIIGDESTLNPYTYNTGYPGLDLVSLLYDTLFQLDQDNKPIPWLVKEYTISEDGLTYNLKLNENIKWHDGKPLTAEDVKFTIDYFLEYPKSRFTNPLKTISSVTVENETDITLVLTKPEPNFMIQPLADLPILPKHIWSSITTPDSESNAIGSGPYILTEYTADQYYKMTANPDYFKEEPPIKEIIFPIIEDTTALYNALKSGEIDAVTSNISPELVSQFESNPSLKIARGAGFSTTLFQINAEKYPMTEKPFRQAINFAIDKQNLVDTVLLGFAEVGSPGFIHPESPFYNSELKPVYDTEKAKQILEDAGFKDTNGDGFREDPNGEEIDLTTLVHSNNPIRIRVAELISESLNGIGIKNTVKALDDTTVISLMWPDYDVSKGRNFDLGIFGWSNTMQLFPDRIVELFYSDPAVGAVNIGGYKNPEFDKLSDQLRATFDEVERQNLIKDLQSFVADEAPIVTLYYQEIVNAYNPSIYDGYVFQAGKGIINKLSFVAGERPVDASENENPSEVEKDKSTDSDTAGESSTEKNNSGILLFGGLIILGVIIFFILKRKKKSANNDDFEF